MEKVRTTLTLSVLGEKYLDDQRSQLRVRIRNTGKVPAFMGKIDVAGAKRALVASDNYFWLQPGESRDLSADVLWREKPTGKVSVQLSAWNTPAVEQPLNGPATVSGK